MMTEDIFLFGPGLAPETISLFVLFLYVSMTISGAKSGLIV